MASKQPVDGNREASTFLPRQRANQREISMMLPTRSKSALIALCLVASGCASFEPGMRHQDLMTPRPPTVQETQNGLEISVEEFVSMNKSMQVFDADLASHGILALLVKVQNNGTQTYSIDEHAILVYLGSETLSSVSGEKAASQAANSEYVGKALFWTILTGAIAGPIGTAASAGHTRAVNKRIEEYFETMSFNYSVLKPNQYAAGFLYWKLPEGKTKLENLRVEATPHEEETENRLFYKLALPILGVSREASPPTSQNSGSPP